MTGASDNTKSFIEQAESIVLENIADEQFGVSELASAMNMSRSNLLRKIRKDVKLSASQFIREVRLKKGMELLKQTSSTVSEISYQVGFGSTSYFIKCFREKYGHSPGETGKRESESESNLEVPTQRKIPWKVITGVIVALAVVCFFFMYQWPSGTENAPEKSIAVLPFKNESSDSSNLYFVNGLMEATLTNLQKIEDLRVISRTSSEKYRRTSRTIPEIADELGVNYVVEGSGQRVGDQVLLNIQLIEASSDRHVWSQQYNREVVDIFALQNEVATKIAKAVKAIVTPAEREQIEKIPTESPEAYDYYLKAMDPFNARTKEGLEAAIPLFEKAIEYDNQFAWAYANIAIAYYFLDIFQQEKQYTEQINNYADKALLYDAKSGVSLIAKAFYYIHTEDYRLALPHLEKALEYNPNSSAVVQMLSDFYAHRMPNTAKYLEYALKGIQLDVAGTDSITRSYSYLHLSNALVQTGFFDEAAKYIDQSLDYNPYNYFSPHLKIFILFALDGDIERTQQRLVGLWNQDTTRLDILQDLAKMYYATEKFDSAFYYFEKFVKAKDANNLDMYPHLDATIGLVYERMGLTKEAEEFFDSYAAYCEEDESIYRSANLAIRYTHEGKLDEAIEQLKLFSEMDNIQYWFLLLEKDPIIQPLKSHPDFEMVFQAIKDRFWDQHERLRATLEEKGLI
ncbi:MAG: helix-turn-helix domain-containing protein [Bacteroidetes bacterium]|nr:helix-turn-helix domain-containing protein [Bacteroidota bacterium]